MRYELHFGSVDEGNFTARDGLHMPRRTEEGVVYIRGSF